jgi:hypothetical protein
MSPSIPPRPVGHHPTPEQLYDARHGPRDAESERILLHAAGCGPCSEEMVRQQAFDRPEPLSTAAVETAWERFGRSPAARPTVRRAPALALAAALAAGAVGLAIWGTLTRPVAEHVERGGVETDVGWQPTGVLAAPPDTFVFPAADGEPRRIRVFDAVQRYTWTSAPTQGTRVPFPAAERRRLQPGVEYYWTVLGGPDQGQAATRSFRLLPEKTRRQ